MFSKVQLIVYAFILNLSSYKPARQRETFTGPLTKLPEPLHMNLFGEFCNFLKLVFINRFSTSRKNCYVSNRSARLCALFLAQVVGLSSLMQSGCQTE